MPSSLEDSAQRRNGMWPFAAGALLIALFVVLVLWQRDVRELRGAATAPSSASAPGAPVAAKSAASAVQTASRERWEQALTQVFTTQDQSTNNEGVTKFTACFDAACGMRMRAQRDAFRKLRHFFGDEKSKVSLASTANAYVALSDCQRPNLFLTTLMVRRGDWLFMKKLAVMADGEVVFERDDLNTHRDNTSGWVLESADLPVLPREVGGLRRVTGAGEVIVRLTGDRGYETLGKVATQEFRASLAKSMEAYLRLDKATESLSSENGCA
jgi:hypothetical protein